MTVDCPDCRSVFRVDPSKVPSTGVRARCSVCGGVILLAGGTLPVSVTPAVATGAIPTPAAASFQPPPSVTAPRSSAASISTMTPPMPTAVAEPTPSFATTPTSVAPPVVPVAAAPVSPKLPINPFLRADPDQRARRLARALVSDLVAYHPQKRDEGLRDGTLRQLFREEIKKSYEEYIEQVGREVAEQSPYFQDALNDILAGGRRLF